MLETNSVERGQRGVELIQSLLGSAIGQPIGVHENLVDLLKERPADRAPDPDQQALQNLPEVQALMQSHLTDHYRKTLDESLPMLDDETPRACAADPGKRKRVIDWLKYLENMGDKAPGPAYDLSWIWVELGLEKYRR